MICGDSHMEVYARVDFQIVIYGSLRIWQAGPTPATGQ
jgi:hypothetical protein